MSHRTGSRTHRAMRRFARNYTAMAAAVYLLVIVVLTAVAGFITPDPSEAVGAPYQAPSAEHWLGTDHLGRSELSRLLHGGQISLGVSVLVVVAVVLLAIPLGLIAGYFGGRTDYLMMRVADAVSGFPSLVLMIVLAGILQPGARSTIIALTVVVTPTMVRLVRAQAMAVRAETYIEASRGIGTPNWRILVKRVLPGVSSPVIVQATILLGTAMLAEASLSFLGLGTQLPTPSWGNMLRDAYSTSIYSHPQLVVFPGVAIALAILAFNLVGDGLRDAFGTARQGPKGRSQRRGITTVDRGDRQVDRAAPAPEGGVSNGLLEIENLSVEFAGDEKPLRVLDGFNLTIRPGEMHCIVGESGCGKSVTCLSILRLLESPPARITSGRIMFEGQDLLSLSLGEMRAIRGNSISMIFQDPMTSLNPAMSIGDHLIEAQRNHGQVSKDVARKRAIEMLELVEVPDPPRRLKQFPHELSGGLRQRVMIAAALINRPKLLLADEPTTALDVTVQAQILEILKSLQKELDMAVVFVTHDLGVVADIADRVTVMYAGQVVEQAEVHDLFGAPQHPYTQGLIESSPRDDVDAQDRLAVIPGSVPTPDQYPAGCRFAARCSHATEECSAAPVELDLITPASSVRCVHAGETNLVLSRRL